MYEENGMREGTSMNSETQRQENNTHQTYINPICTCIILAFPFVVSSQHAFGYERPFSEF